MRDLKFKLHGKIASIGKSTFFLPPYMHNLKEIAIICGF